MTRATRPSNRSTAPSGASVTSPQSPATSDSSGTLLVIIVALLGVAVLGAGIAIYLVRRARYTPVVGSQGADGFAAPGQPTSSDDATRPFTRGDY
ncbi:MAG TPA: hypothetical protein VF040_22590 [Ktedonobacterales bacterium]